MTATTTERSTLRRDGQMATYGVLAATKVLGGTLACLTAAGYLQGGATSTTLKTVGVFDETVDNTSGASADVTARVRRDGWHCFINSASTDLITIADIGASCYVVDNQTVAKTSGTNTRSVAGTVRAVDTDGVWISFA